MGPIIQQTQSQCSSCHGTGNQIDAKHRCKKCSGKKIFKEKKVLDVNVTHGSQNGETIKFIGEANQSVNIFNTFLFFQFLFI
jgi:DnaJ family protein A protein 2